MSGIADKAYNIGDLRRLAQARLPRAIWEFLERGTEDDLLTHENIAALQRIKLVPRVARDVASRDQSITLFGRKQPMPLIIAPTGIADLMSWRGERAVAQAAAQAGIAFSQATSSTTPFSEIARIVPEGRWCQLYLWEERQHSLDLIARAADEGFETLVLTVDLPVWPLREHNKRNGMANPIRPNARLAWDFARHPRWLMGTMGRYMLNGGVPQFANYPQEARGKVTGVVSRVTNSPSVTWRDVAELKRRWPRNLVVKGVLSADDAKAARDHGADGVCVSNHGGRVFDSAPASIDMLAGVVDAVGRDATVIWDGGVRRGADVLKAMALGAQAVMIGRATLYGAAAGGAEGAALALEILRNEIDIGMAMLGVTSLSELDRGFVQTVRD